MAENKSKKKLIITLSILAVIAVILIATAIVGSSHVKSYEEKHSWKNVVQISASFDKAVGLREDGTFVITGCNAYAVDETKFGNFVLVKAGQNTVYGINKDGTVESLIKNTNSDTVENWTDIVDIGDCDSFVVGLRADGTVVMTDGED